MRRYPDDNCAAIYSGLGDPKDQQAQLPLYLKHSSGVGICSALLNTGMIAQQVQKPWIMFETNTASCGGFQGVSNVFASTLWALDYGLQMVYSNMTHALIHVGGQDVYYNVSIVRCSNTIPRLTTRASTALHS